MPVTPPTPPAVPQFYRGDTLQPEHSVGLLMKLGLQSILLQADRALAALDLTHAQWLPLFRLGRGEQCTAATLARKMSQDPGAMTRALDRLEAKGLIRRERSGTDRRVVQVVLTDAGRDVAAQVPPVLAEVLNQHLAGFGHDEWQQLLGLLRRLVDNGERLREGGLADASAQAPAGAGAAAEAAEAAKGAATANAPRTAAKRGAR